MSLFNTMILIVSITSIMLYFIFKFFLKKGEIKSSNSKVDKHFSVIEDRKDRKKNTDCGTPPRPSIPKNPKSMFKF